jgi:hypothetical protein
MDNQTERQKQQADQGGQQIDKSQIDALLKSFEFSPLRFDRFILRNWHIFTVDVYAILLIFLIILNWHTNGKPRNYLNCTINTHLNCLYSVNDLLTWNNILFIVAAALGLLVFNRLQREIAPTFRKLLDKRYISLPKGNMNTACLQFLSAYKDALKSPKRYLLCGLALTTTLVYLLSEFTGPLQSAFVLKDPLLWFIFVSIQLLLGLSLLALAYCAGVVAWTIAVTAWHIKKLTRKFDFFIVPNHPDKCGGLKFLGIFCLDMAFPILIGGVVLGIYSIQAYFSGSIRFYSLMSSVALVLFALPLAFLVLYNTLWDIHLKMVNEAEKAEEDFALLLFGLQSKMQSSLEKHMWEDAKAVKDKIDLAQIVNPDTIKYPTWPFDRSILLKFWTPQIVPILGLFLNLTAPISDALKALITILSGNH